MATSKDDILDTIASMSVMEVVELVSAMEEKFGVSAAAAVMVSGDAGAGAAAEEKTEFDVFLKAIGANKIAVIKVVRTLMGLGLKEAKDLVESADSAPAMLKEATTKEEADKFKQSLEEAGAQVDIK